jgi:single-strand DNA-binding protein
MAGSVNKVVLIGRVGKDPEIRSFNSGDRVANFSIATSEKWKDKATGEKKEKTEWHNIAVFNENLVKVVESYVKKGSMIYVEGQLSTRKYQKNGEDRYITEIVLRQFKGELTLLESKGEREGGGGGGGSDEYGFSGPSSGARQDARGNPVSDPSGFDDFDDSIPF